MTESKTGAYPTAWLVPDLRSCEVVEGYFAWFTQVCGVGTYRVLNIHGEARALCSRHEARALTHANGDYKLPETPSGGSS